jgi:uncharacterized protein YfaS (alpha-2-macroglobulin family)
MKIRISTLIALIIVVSCKQKPTTVPAYDRSFSGYIQSFTSGVISKKSEIAVHFLDAIDSAAMALAGDDVLMLNPEIKGRISFPDKYTLAFTPDEDLEPGTVYNASLHLSKLMEVPDSLKIFQFGFQVLRPDYEWGDLSLDAMSDQSMDWYLLTGNILSADDANIEEIEKLVSVEVNEKEYPLNIMETSTRRVYQFSVDSIPRTNKEQSIRIIPNINLPGAASMKVEELELPALGNFKYLNHHAKSGENPVLTLNFSDPLNKSQDLSGLIRLEGISELKFEIKGSSVKAYPGKEVSGEIKLEILKGIENIAGHGLMNPAEITVKFKDEKPRVELIGNGNILPVSDNLVLPFKAIGLTAVDVKVVKIPTSNLLQFFQNNSYDGSSELYRVGEVAARKTINLSAKGNLKNWNNFAIDLADLMKPEPGAVYRVYLSFRQEHSLYVCEEADPRDLEDQYYWYHDEYRRSGGSIYNYDDYYFNYPPGYSWRYRDNPCHISYYNNQNFAVRNVMVSDLGVIVKKASDQELDITVTDLISAKPEPGTLVRLYNYQGRELGTVRTDKDGWARFTHKATPYILVAEKGDHRTYLTIQSGTSLSISNFPVGGNAVKDGVKGYMYAERSVWRPGDSIYLNFILEDIQGSLPLKHPIQFELKDPRGMSVDRQIRNIGEGRIYNFTTHTAGSAPTGVYRAKIRIGEHSFEKSLMVEMVKPNRLSIYLDLGERVLKSADGRAPAQLNVKWLTGIPAENAEVQIMATASQHYRPFDDYKSYSFTDPVFRFERTESEVFNGAVGEDGTAKIDLDISNYGRVPGMLHGRFVVKAFEGGGDFSTQYFDSKIATYPRYVGMKIEDPESYYYESGKEYEVDLKTLDPEGEFLDGEDLEVKIYTIGHYWWYSNRNGLSSYVNNDAKYLVETKTITTENGQGKFMLSIPSKRWGRFLVRVCDKEGGHCTGRLVYFDWPEDMRRNRKTEQGTTILTFRAEKEKFEIGEKIKATIPADDGSRVLVTIENGSGILSKQWLEPEDGKVEFITDAVSEMAPNVYISAHLLQPHSQTENDRPIRLYGIVPVEVYDPSTQLEPEIEVAEVWRPETSVNIKVSEKSGMAMQYTLAVVDDGLLNLTNFKTPDPWHHFFAKEALGVSTWDMFNAVLGVFGGTLEQIFAIGGDSELMKSEKSNQNRFKPMVQHIGPFYLAANETAIHQLEIPNYVGSVRVMVVAADKKRAYGSAEKSVIVRKPLMVLTSLPRMLSPGDELSLPVTVFAMEDQVKEVELKLTTKGLVDAVGETTRSLTFEKNGEEVVDFRLRVPKERGEAQVRVEASSGIEKAYDQTELKVRIPSAEETESFTFSLKPGTDTTLSYQPLGVSGGNSHIVVAATMPALDLEKRLKYLTGYPHGCTEQIVSRAFPMLYLGDLMELDQEMKLIVKQNISMALQHIYERQVSDGSILYWPGYTTSSPYGYITSYAGHFLWEANAKGYQIPEGAIDRWEKFQTGYARSWRPLYNSSGYFYNHLDQSYRLYTLALVGKAEIGAMNRLKTLLSDQESSLWYLAAAYYMAGEEEVARDLAAQASKSRATSTRYYYYYYCNSSLRTDAIRLMVMKQLGQEAQALKVARKMALDINSSRWYSTHGLAYALRALLKTYADNARGGQMNWTFKSDSESYTQGSDFSYDRYKVSRSPDESYAYSVKNTGDITTNFTVSRTGIPIRFDVPAKNSNLGIYVQYVDLNGNEIDVSSLKQGTQFEAIVSISRMGVADGYQEMALTQLIPSGWEIVNTRVTGTQNSDAEDYYQYRDIRDDRVYTYFSMKYKRSRKFRIRLNATYAGKFYMPPIKAEDMYDHEINANTTGQWVEVKRK